MSYQASTFTPTFVYDSKLRLKKQIGHVTPCIAEDCIFLIILLIQFPVSEELTFF